MNLLFKRTIFGSDRDTVKDLIADMMDCINAWNDLKEDEEFEFRLILNELIANGITHGNERCQHKALIASIREVSRDTISICIQDEGDGFNHNACIHREYSLYTESGRGLKIIQELCDEVRFHYNGSQVEISKSLRK